jgi:hypothetical protein
VDDAVEELRRVRGIDEDLAQRVVRHGLVHAEPSHVAHERQAHHSADLVVREQRAERRGRHMAGE